MYFFFCFFFIYFTGELTVSKEYFKVTILSLAGGLFVSPREVTVEGDQRKVRIEGLMPATTYLFTVVAENRVGKSQPSSPLRAVTQEEAPSGHPQNVRVN